MCVSNVETEKNMVRRLEKMDTNTREYRRYDAVGRQITVRLIPPFGQYDPLPDFLASLNDHFEHVLRDVDDIDMVGITIQIM